MKNIFYSIILLVVAAACAKSEIPTWDAKPRAWFTEANDTTLFTFLSQPDVTEFIVEIPISMAGMVDSTDREVAVKDLGCGNPATQYEIVSAFIPKGEVTGNLSVRVTWTENLDVANDTIGFEIEASDIFEVGQEEYLKNYLIVSNLVSKPVWWDEEDGDYVLGNYTDQKMQIVYAVLTEDEIDAMVNDWYGAAASIAVYKLNQYCKENGIIDPETEDILYFG